MKARLASPNRNWTPDRPRIGGIVRQIVIVACAAVAACSPAERREIDQTRKDVQESARDITAAAAGVKAAADVITDRTTGRTSLHPSDAYVKNSERQLCTAQHPGDTALQTSCMEKMDRGAATLGTLGDKYREVAPMQAALAKCVDDQTRAGVTDFALAGACAQANDRDFETRSK